MLRRHWESAKDGEGQVVLLSAPAGFGKSRIAATFRGEVRSTASACPQYFGSPFHTASPFYPFIGQLEWTAGITRADSALQKLDKLEAVLEEAAEEKSESARLLAALLSIPCGDRYAPLQINKQVQKQRTMDELLERLIGPSVRGPTLAIFEDAHWFDPTSLELMGAAVRRAAHQPMMIVVTHRPELLPPWLELGHVTLLKLSNLARRDAIALIRKAAGDKALPDPLVGRFPPRRRVCRFLSKRLRGQSWSWAIWKSETTATSYATRVASSLFPPRCRTPSSRDSIDWEPQERSPRRIDHRQRVSLRTHCGGAPGPSRQARSRLGPPRSLRPWSTGRATELTLPVQACTDSRRRVPDCA